ncbi:MAG: Mor transcription activator family protein [Negativicutes bacterium]|nr:Mor transcription activator family protein [Negativicutes bacterium]
MDSEQDKRLDAEVRIEDFPAAFQPIVNALGIPVALDLVRVSGGVSQYIPKYDALISQARDRIILKEFTGYNYRELALRYNLTEVWVRNIVDKDKSERMRTEYEKNQTNLFVEAKGAAS